MMGTARRAVYTAAALTALTVLTLPGNPHRGMGFFELLALPLWLPFFSGRDWPDWQFLPAAAAAIFVWLWAWTFAAYWVISRVQKRKRNGI